MSRVISERLEESTRLGPYEIIRRIARGGMAELFLGRGPSGLVVLKQILPKYADHPRFVQLFFDEARLAGSLAHPNIVRVYEAGGAGASCFIAMEYLHGQDVRSILHRAWTLGEKVPVPHAVYIASRVAAALHYAHEQRRPDGTLLGLVHRDVSPSNVIVTYDGEVKLVDFGVAKAATSSVKTRTGTLKGKISYMSPEQAKGAPVDRRSDVFSLGIVLWEMVATQRLFKGENDLQTLQLIIHQPPRRPSEVQPACPAELERIIMRALAQDPAERYPTAAELLEDIEVLGLGSEPEELAAYVAQLFSPEVSSWQAAKAAGIGLAEHLTSGGELTTPLTESDFVEAIELSAMEEEEEEEEDDDDELTEIPARPPSPPMPRRAAPTPPSMPVVGAGRRAGATSPPGLGGGRSVRAQTPSTPVPVVQGQVGSGPVPVVEQEQEQTLSGPAPAPRPHTPSGPYAVPVRAHTPSEPVPTAVPRAHTPSDPAPTAGARPHSPSGPYPVMRAHTPSGPVPVVRPSGPITAAAALGGPVAVRPRTASHGVPVVGLPVEPPVVAPAEPWPLASGSTPSTSSATAAAIVELTPPPGALDPSVADRLLRRGVWVGAGILGVVVIVAIAMSGGSSVPARARAGEADRAASPPPPSESTPVAAPVPPPAPAAITPAAAVHDAGVPAGGSAGAVPAADPAPTSPPSTAPSPGPATPTKKKRPSAPGGKKKTFDPNSPLPP